MKGAAIPYSQDELAWIEANSKRPRREAHADFQRIFDRPDVALTNLNSLCKRKGWMTGRTGCFEPGQEAHNKGKRMPFNANSARTQFKKGNRPHTYRGPGHEFTCPKDGYVYMIVSEPNPHTGGDTRRVLKHRWLWEQINGPLPEDMCLKSLDGDRANTDPANWMVIPRAMMPRLSGRWTTGYDDAAPELKPTILATAQLHHALREARKPKP